MQIYELPTYIHMVFRSTYILKIHSCIPETGVTFPAALAAAFFCSWFFILWNLNLPCCCSENYSNTLILLMHILLISMLTHFMLYLLLMAVCINWIHDVPRLIGAGDALVRCMLRINFARPYFHSMSDCSWNIILLFDQYQIQKDHQ